MSLAKILTEAVVGLEALPVEVEVDVTRGLPGFSIVGLPDKAVEEAKERVRSAIRNSFAEIPDRKIIINLAPADIKKEGPGYDLPIAMGILLASRQIKETDEITKAIFLGELALDGRVRQTAGVLPMVMAAKGQGIKKIFLPRENIPEAMIVENLELYGLENLRDLILHFRGEKEILPTISGINLDDLPEPDFEADFAYIKGQEHAKRALEIAAAGGHNVLMNGPPGSGKTLLSRAFASILPKMSLPESLEVTKIYSVAGILNPANPVVRVRPFRSPHHTSSDIALVGGGRIARPGEISLAHRGVLFLDELPEFSRSVLEVLRQPLEEGVVTVARATGSVTFPAKFILIAAQNPCPCGYLGDSGKQCICSPSSIVKYEKRVSGPLLDRVDLHVSVPRLEYDKLISEKVAEESKFIRKRVQRARDIQEARFLGTRIFTNAEMKLSDIKKYCVVDEEIKKLLELATTQLNLSARAYHRILKIARTIADLEEQEMIKKENVAEALQYRPKEKLF